MRARGSSESEVMPITRCSRGWQFDVYSRVGLKERHYYLLSTIRNTKENIGLRMMMIIITTKERSRGGTPSMMAGRSMVTVLLEDKACPSKPAASLSEWGSGH